jgi:hypothetical protein
MYRNERHQAAYYMCWPKNNNRGRPDTAGCGRRRSPGRAAIPDRQSDRRTRIATPAAVRGHQPDHPHCRRRDHVVISVRLPGDKLPEIISAMETIMEAIMRRVRPTLALVWMLYVPPPGSNRHRGSPPAGPGKRRRYANAIGPAWYRPAERSRRGRYETEAGCVAN